MSVVIGDFSKGDALTISDGTQEIDGIVASNDEGRVVVHMHGPARAIDLSKDTEVESAIGRNALSPGETTLEAMQAESEERALTFMAQQLNTPEEYFACIAAVQGDENMRQAVAFAIYNRLRRGPRYAVEAVLKRQREQQERATLPIEFQPLADAKDEDTDVEPL